MHADVAHVHRRIILRWLGRSRLISIGAFGAAFLAVHLARAEASLYPFVKDRKWGYIDSTGEWKISPRFNRAVEIFDGDKIKVWEGDRWGYVDRAGNWLVKPKFIEPVGWQRNGYQVVRNGKKEGVLGPDLHQILPLAYDKIELWDDRAFVRREQKLGVFGFDGTWKKPLELNWPRNRSMPIATASNAAWFREGKKWGVISREGKILFPAQFAAHEMRRRESEDWNHPEGVDFEEGRAWVFVGADCCLITDEGKVLLRQPFAAVRKWTNDLYVVRTKAGLEGIVSRQGETLLAPRFHEIRPVSDGMAVVIEREEHRKPDGETETLWRSGYLDPAGHIVVDPGTYDRDLKAFSEGLAPVWKSPPGNRYDPYAGYIDRAGQIVIPLQFLQTTSFLDGLGAFQEAERLEGLSPKAGLWGYVDHSGTAVIKPQFGGAKPFFRDRAWVLKPGGQWDRAEWAMIDRSGNVLTAYAYFPPEQFENYENRGHERLGRSRWRGELAVLVRSEFALGLATRDGAVLVEPQFNRIGEFHDGRAIAIEQKNPSFPPCVITERGEILARGEYTEIKDFEGGVAWVSKRWTDHRGPFVNPGWGLIDRQAHVLLDLKYVEPSWVSTGRSYTDRGNPGFSGELAGIALANTYQPYSERPWLTNSWGYVNRAGNIVAWHDKEAREK